MTNTVRLVMLDALYQEDIQDNIISSCFAAWKGARKNETCLDDDGDDDDDLYRPRSFSLVVLMQQLDRNWRTNIPKGFSMRGFRYRFSRRQRYHKWTRSFLDMVGIDDIDEDEFIAACRRHDEIGTSSTYAPRHASLPDASVTIENMSCQSQNVRQCAGVGTKEEWDTSDAFEQMQHTVSLRAESCARTNKKRSKRGNQLNGLYPFSGFSYEIRTMTSHTTGVTGDQTLRFANGCVGLTPTE